MVVNPKQEKIRICKWFLMCLRTFCFKLKYDLKSAFHPYQSELCSTKFMPIQFLTNVFMKWFNAILIHLFSKLICSNFSQSSSLEKPMLQLCLFKKEWTMYYFHEHSRNSVTGVSLLLDPSWVFFMPALYTKVVPLRASIH